MAIRHDARAPARVPSRSKSFVAPPAGPDADAPAPLDDEADLTGAEGTAYCACRNLWPPQGARLQRPSQHRRDKSAPRRRWLTAIRHGPSGDDGAGNEDRHGARNWNRVGRRARSNQRAGGFMPEMPTAQA